VAQSVSGQLVEADEMLLLGLVHPHVRDVEQRLNGANEAAHVELLRKEHSTNGI